MALMGGARLVTLTGGPGMGKTRLAIEVASLADGDLPDGVWFVPLAGVTEDDAVVQAVRSAVPGRKLPGHSALESVLAGIGGKQMLVVLDGCEYVVAACAEMVGALLGGCPGLRVLATSQERLAVGGEHLWPVGGLSLAPAGGSPEGATANADAVRLFEVRATAARRGFVLRPEVIPAVVEICRRLDGIPLAIELAAAQIAVFSPAEIAERLDDRFGFLTGGNQRTPPRHQTLKAAVDWSYGLLSDPERALLGELSVFAGGFTLESVEEVRASGDADCESCLEQVTGLVAKSLVYAEAGPQGTRYRMLETIRDYGRDRLLASGTEPAVAERHLASYASLAQRAAPELTGPNQQSWLGRLDAEHDNLSAAFRWSLANDRAEVALGLVESLTLFWRTRGHFTQGCSWLDQALMASDGETSPHRAGALWGRGLLAAMVGDHATAVAAGEASLVMSRELGDRRGFARSLLLLGSCALVSEGAEASVPILQGAVEQARATGDSWCLAHALALCGSSFSEQGDVGAARPGFEECITVALAAQDEQCLAFGLNGLGHQALEEGDYASAELHLEVALARARSTGCSYEIAQALSYLALVALGQGHLERARAHLDEAMPVAEATASVDAVIYATEARARLVLAEGDLDAADRLFTDGLAVAQAAGGTSPPALQGLGEVALARKDPAKALGLLDQACQLARASGHRGRTGDALWALGDVARLESDDVRAATLHHQALALRTEIGDMPGLAASLEAVAATSAAVGRSNQAARALAAAQALRLARGYARTAAAAAGFEATRTFVRQALGDAPFEAAWADGAALSPESAATYLAKGRGRRQDRPKSGWASLTVAERDVATLAAEGLTNAEIARNLFVSANTVKTHLSRVFAKLGVSSRRDLTRRLTQDA